MKRLLSQRTVALCIGASNQLTDLSLTPAEEYWQMEVKKAMEYWFSNTILPFYNEQKDRLNQLVEETQEKTKDLTDKAQQQLETVDEKIVNLDDMLKQGVFDGNSVLGGIGEPGVDLGKTGDWYINQSNVGEHAWHIYRKEEAGWVDQRSIIGRDGNNKNLFGVDLETAEMLTPFYELHTKAEIIASQHELPTVNRKISSNDIYYKDSHDETKTVEKELDKLQLYAMNDKGIIVVPDGTNPKSLLKSGLYWAKSWAQGSIPLSSSYCVIQVILNDDYTVFLTAYYPTSQTIFTNSSYKSSEPSGDLKGWFGWKLISGEVKLWEGSVQDIGSTITLEHDLSMFSNLRAVVYYNNCIAPCDTKGKSMINFNYMFNYYDNSETIIRQAAFEIVDNRTLKLYSNVIQVDMYYGKNTTCVKIPVTAVYGRP